MTIMLSGIMVFSHSTDLKSTPTTMWGRSSPHLEIVRGVNFKSLRSKATTPDTIHRNWGAPVIGLGVGVFLLALLVGASDRPRIRLKIVIVRRHNTGLLKGS